MTTNDIKEAAPLIWAEIEKAKNILLNCHPSPDQDSVGSSLAMKLALEGKGKKVTLIIGDSAIPNWTKFLPIADTILAKNYFEVDIDEFDLFLILDTNALNRISALRLITFPPHLKTVVIDHHQGEGCGEINLVATDYPATAAILTDLFKEWGISFTRDMAVCLMTGLHADTGGFKYPRTTAHIFNLAAELALAGPDFYQVLNQIYGLNSLDSRRLMGQVFSTFEVLFDGKVAIGILSQEDFNRLGVKVEEAHNTGLSSMLRDIEGVKVGVLLVEEEPGIVKISTRSADGECYDVAALMKEFGGGGHRAAAGATVHQPLLAVKASLIAALMSLL
ncbi:MAG: bifunctional oligoribonuclease/PAP phosphatase NrnA [bacterium]|nr:bifunctional oligoribonuclease/PAP phosphatase NrnA [bacterium]